MPSTLELVQSNFALTFGVVFAAVVLGIRAATTDAELRRDLRGVLVMLASFFGFRILDWLLQGQVGPAVVTALHICWILTFAFALIRSAVGLGAWMVRLRGTPVPKIVRDVVDYSLYALVAIPVLRAEGIVHDFSSLLAGSAIVSIVLGLASQETLGNLFAGLSIQIERPFQVGDYVEVKDEIGRVVQVAWRATRIETPRNEVITVPNNVLAKESVKNLSRGALPVGFDLYFGASYEVPPNKVKDTVLETLAQIGSVLSKPSPKCRTYAFDDSSIRYQLRFFVEDYSQLSQVRDEVLTRLWYALRREAIDLPFPQRTLHFSEAPAPLFPKEQRVELLRTVDIFSVLDAQDLQRLAHDLRPRQFGQGERVIEQGQPGTSFYLIGAGQFSVQAANGAEVSRLGPGQYFGEMSLLTGEPRNATVVAAEDAVLFELDRPTFARLFDQHADLARQLSARLAQRRTKLRAVVEASGAADASPEAGRILTKLRQIFGLKGE